MGSKDELCWPDLAEMQRCRSLKYCAPNQSFAQKVLTGSPLKNNMIYQGPRTYQHLRKRADGQSASKDTFKDNCKQESGCSNEQNNATLSSDKSCKLQTLCSSKVQTNQQKKQKPTGIPSKKLLSADSKVSIIDCSQKQKWMESQVSQSIFPAKLQLVSEEDFPELMSALQRLSKCIVKNEVHTDPEISPEIICTDSFKKKQPRRKDPISVNILDILKRKPKACLSRTKRAYTKGGVMLGGHFLGSSNGIQKRGKQRETPANKTLSKLKLVILDERRRKQKERESLLQISSENCSVFGEPSIKSVSDALSSMRVTCCPNVIKESSSIPVHNEKAINSFRNVQEKPCDDCQICNPDHADLSKHSKSGIVASKPSGITVDKNVKQQPYLVPAPHSRKFREYCDNILSNQLDEAVISLLKELYRFQDRLHQRDPVKAHAKRRFVLGIREVKKYLTLKKLKTIVIAPDLEPCLASGGLDETIMQIREDGKIQQVPVIFAVGRRKLGNALKKKVPISIVGIINPEGAENLYKAMINDWCVAVQQYTEKVLELSNSQL